MASKLNAAIAGVSEATIEFVKEAVPFSACLIEGVRKYRENIEEQQHAAFIDLLSARVEKLEKNAKWYSTDSGKLFVQKMVATALNAEYADKLEYLANAFVNGPLLDDDAHRFKFVEMIRSLSKPALDVLVASLEIEAGQIIVERLAEYMRWSPYLVDACVAELRSAGVFSSVVAWNGMPDGAVSKRSYLSGNGNAKNQFTMQFAQFIV